MMLKLLETSVNNELYAGSQIKYFIDRQRGQPIVFRFSKLFDKINEEEV
jgi:hypothetical protein